MSPSTTTYYSSWRDQVVDGKRFDWIQPIPGYSSKVKCSLCNSKPFSVSNGGFSDCKH